MFNKLRSGLEVYEDRHCGRADPGREQRRRVLPLVPTVPTLPLPGVPRCRLPTLADHEELEALVPDELLDRINKFAFANAPARSGPGAGLQEAGAPIPTVARRRSTRT